MANKKYNVLVRNYPAMARSKRLNGQKVSGGSGSTIVTGGNAGNTIDPSLIGDGHTHYNLAALNRLTVDTEEYLRVQVDNPQAGKEGQTATIKEKAKVGYADKAKNADYSDLAHDLDPDSPVNDRFLSALEADEAAGLIRFKKGLISDDFVQFNNGLLVRSGLTRNRVLTDFSDALTEDVADAVNVVAEIIEEGNDPEQLTDSLMEVAATEGEGATTLGGLTNVSPFADEISVTDRILTCKVDSPTWMAEKFIRTGWIAVETLSERDALDTIDMQKGIMCYVFEEDLLYKWTGVAWEVKELGNPVVGVQRNLRIVNNLDSKSIAASKNEPCLLQFTFISQERYKSSDPYEDTGERGLLEVSVKNSDHAEYIVVKQMYINSAVPFSLDVAEYLTSGANQIMLKVTGEVTGETTPAFVYTVQLTSLSIAATNFRWYTAFTGLVSIPLNIGGNISKKLYVTVTGDNYIRSYEEALGLAVYTETAYNYQLEHPGRSGVFHVSMYVANMDGTIRTRTISYNIICAVAGEAVKLIAINNVLDKATNWTENSLFDYTIYDGSNAITNARFIVKKEGVSVFSSDEDSIPTSTKHTFFLPMEIETMDNTDFNISVEAMDGDRMLASLPVIPVNNSLGFSSVAGAVFYMNPRTRSNNQGNYLSVVNEMDGSTVPVDWNGMNWGNDGWITDADAYKVLRVMAGAKVVIGYKVFAKEAARLGKTVEIDYRADNVTDFNYPIVKVSSDGDSFVGLRLFPDNVVMFSNALKTVDDQSINLFEGRRVRLTLVIMPDAYGNSGFNLCIVYVNGVKNREFMYGSNDYFTQTSDIEIGSGYADVDVYGIRVYDSALTSEAVLRNYINWLADKTEKISVQADNDVMDGNGSEVDFENVKDQFNVFVFDNSFPSLANPNKMKGTLQVFYADHPEWNVSISDVEAKGQGTSSMRYWKWNVRFTLSSGWAMMPSLPKATKITAKKNFASSMQSHKIGSVNSVDDLYKAMGYLNEAMETGEYNNARVAVFQLPFVAFEKSVNDEGKDVYTFMGLYTMGPDKGDKKTFGHDTDLFPGLISIEGADNSPLCALFRVPWSNRMQYNEEEEAFQYNGANSWDFGAGNVANISKWIPAYNLAYVCSDRLKPFNGTLAELNAQVGEYRNEPFEFWIAKTGDANLFNVYYYEASEGKFIASDTGEGGINLITQLVDKDYGLASSDLEGKSPAELNELFIAARIQKFRKEAPLHWDIDDAILHRNWTEFHAGTDNRAKNTYPYCFGEPGSKWKWRYDDLDTIFDTDNQGQAKKGYSVEFHDTYATGGSVWNGETSNFWNLLDLAYPDEIFAGMRKMMTTMEELSGLKSGTDFDKLYAYFQKYYFSQAQEYFPQNLYNADAKFSYENAKLAYENGRYTNDTDPITQSQGDHYLAEQRWITKRILYMMSKYSFGLFSADGTDNITVRAAGNTITYEITPAIDMYPAIANGTSIIRGQRTKAGELCEMLIELSGSGDQQNTIQAASYLQDIGDWHDKNVTGSMIIQGRMLRDIRLGSKTENMVISITSLTLSNCISLQNLVLSNITTLTGTLNLIACTHLRKVYAGGTSLTQLVLPQGGGLELVEYSAYNQYVSLQNYPLITNDGVLVDFCKEKITDFFVVNCPLLKPMELLSSIMAAQESQGSAHVLKHVRVVGFKEYHDNGDILDALKQLADGTYMGLDSSGIAGEEEIPVLEGTISIDSYVYQDALDALTGVFGRLTIEAKGFCVRFADPEVLRVLLNASTGNGSNVDGFTEVQRVDGNRDGVLTKDELAAIHTLSDRADNTYSMFVEGYEGGISVIEYFDELRYFTGLTFINSSAFRNCSSLKQITLPETIVEIRDSAFNNTALNKLIINEGCKICGNGILSDAINCALIDFPSTMTSIGTNPTNRGYVGLRIICRALVPPSFAGNWSFTPGGKPTAIYVPDKSVDIYKSASGWSDSKSIIYPLSNYTE